MVWTLVELDMVELDIVELNIVELDMGEEEFLDMEEEMNTAVRTAVRAVVLLEILTSPCPCQKSLNGLM